MLDPSQQHVAQVPGVVRRKVNRVGPTAQRRIERIVDDGVVDLHFVTDGGRSGHHHIRDFQVGRRRHLEKNRLRGSSRIVHVVAEFAHPAERAATKDAGWIGDDEYVIRTVQIARRGDGDAAVVASRSAQSAAMRLVACIAVGVDVQETVLGQVHQIVPATLVGRRVATGVDDTISHREWLPGDHRLRRVYRRDLQVGRGGQGDRYRHRRHVVTFVPELLDDVDAVLVVHCLQAIADAARGGGVAVDKNAGVGLDDNVELAADGLRQFEGGGVGVRLAGLEVFRYRLAARVQFGAHVAQARAQLGFDFFRPVHQRKVGVVEGQVARQVHPVEPAILAGRAGAPVGHRPAYRHQLPRAHGGGGQPDSVDLQIGFAIGNVQLAARHVVVFARTLKDAGGVEPGRRIEVAALVLLGLRLVRRGIAQTLG